MTKEISQMKFEDDSYFSSEEGYSFRQEIIKSETDTDLSVSKDIQMSEYLSVSNLLKLCEDQDSLLKEEDEQIGRLITQLSDYEQELYERTSISRN